MIIHANLCTHGACAWRGVEATRNKHGGPTNVFVLVYLQVTQHGGSERQNLTHKNLVLTLLEVVAVNFIQSQVKNRGKDERPRGRSWSVEKRKQPYLRGELSSPTTRKIKFSFRAEEWPKWIRRFERSRKATGLDVKNAKPFSLSVPRKVPLPLYEETKKQLDRMLE